MDIQVFMFMLLVLIAVVCGVIYIGGLILEAIAKTEEYDFDDIEGIKNVFTEEDKS